MVKPFLFIFISAFFILSTHANASCATGGNGQAVCGSGRCAVGGDGQAVCNNGREFGNCAVGGNGHAVCGDGPCAVGGNGQAACSNDPNGSCSVGGNGVAVCTQRPRRSSRYSGEFELQASKDGYAIYCYRSEDPAGAPAVPASYCLNR